MWKISKFSPFSPFSLRTRRERVACSPPARPPAVPNINVLFWLFPPATKSPLSSMCFAQTHLGSKCTSSLSENVANPLNSPNGRIEISCYEWLWWSEEENMLLSAAQERNRKQLCLIRVPKSFTFHLRTPRRVSGDQKVA